MLQTGIVEATSKRITPEQQQKRIICIKEPIPGGALINVVQRNIARILFSND